MAATLHYNVSGEFATELLQPGEGINNCTIGFSNVHATLPCFIDLYIKKVNLGTFYIIKNIKLPAGASLDVSDIGFDNRSTGFGLFVKLTKSASETPIVDIIIR